MSLRVLFGYSFLIWIGFGNTGCTINSDGTSTGGSLKVSTIAAGYLLIDRQINSGKLSSGLVTDSDENNAKTSVDSSLWSVGLKSYFGAALNPTSPDGANAVMYTWKKKSLIMCYISHLTQGIAKEADKLTPVDGTFTVTVTKGMSDLIGANCGGDWDDNAIGENFTMTFSTPTDKSYYDKKLTLDEMPEFTAFFRVSPTVIRFAFFEAVSFSESDVTAVGYNRILTEISTDNVLRFESVYRGFTDVTYYTNSVLRFSNDSVKDESRIYYYNDDLASDTEGHPEEQISFTAVGKPLALGTLAFSFSSKNFSDGIEITNLDVTDSSSCVNMSTGAIATNNSLSCTLAGVVVSGPDAAVAVAQLTAFPNSASLSASKTSHLVWTSSTIFTSPPVSN